MGRNDFQVAPTPKLKERKDFTFGPAFTFRLRIHVGGPFAEQSLWELSRLDSKGEPIKIISDADKLENCLDNLVGEMQAAGY